MLRSIVARIPSSATGGGPAALSLQNRVLGYTLRAVGGRAVRPQAHRAGPARVAHGRRSGSGSQSEPRSISAADCQNVIPDRKVLLRNPPAIPWQVGHFMKSQLLVVLVLFLAIGLTAAPQASRKPLTQDQIMELVKGSVPSSRVADLVRENGISFEPTEEYFRALRSAGAEPVLLDALGAARAAKSPEQDVAGQAKQHIKAANALMDTGDIDGAIVLYQKAIQVRPGDAEAHRLLGVALGKKKDWQRDITEQRMAIQLNPDDAAAKTELAVALHSAEAEQARRDEPHVASPVKAPAQDTSAQAQQVFAAGQLQVGQRKFEAAAISFSEAAQLRPDWADPLVERAKVYMKLYLFREAIHSYDQAVKLKPNDPVILNLRGYANYSASEFKRAVADFDEAIRLNPNMSEAYQNRGNAKWQMGDKAGANMDFEKAKLLGSGAQARKNTKRR